MRKKRKVYSSIVKGKGLSAAEEEECILQNTAEACFSITCTCLSHMLTKAKMNKAALPNVGLGEHHAVNHFKSR